MMQFGEIVPAFLRYVLRILPSARKQYILYQSMQSLCLYDETRHPVERNSNEYFTGLAIPARILPALLPGVDTEGMISFALSISSIYELIEHYRKDFGIYQEMEIRKLYGCLSCAVDPSRNSACPMIHSIKNKPRSDAAIKKEPPAQSCLTDCCRLQLALLPSYRLVAPKLKKYVQFFIDLQSYRHYPSHIGTDMLKVWSSGFLQRYRDISWWEFCAASDSFFGLLLMYAAASNPELSSEEAGLLDEACFPWLCGLESLLRSVLQMRKQESEELNFSGFYNNLKECEERIIFFAEKAAASFMKLKNGDKYNSMIKQMISFYLTETEAEFGMLKLAGSSILKNSSAVKYANAWRLLRMFGIIRETEPV